MIATPWKVCQQKSYAGKTENEIIPWEISVFSDRVEGMLADYHNYTELMSELDSLVESYPHLARIYSLGNTTENRELIVIQISQGVTEVTP